MTVTETEMREVFGVISSLLLISQS